jgi:hypothetical protein
MRYDEHTKIGRLWMNPAARELLLRHMPIQGDAPTFVLVRGMSLRMLAEYSDAGWLEPLLADLAALPPAVHRPSAHARRRQRRVMLVSGRSSHSSATESGTV